MVLHETVNMSPVIKNDSFERKNARPGPSTRCADSSESISHLQRALNKAKPSLPSALLGPVKVTEVAMTDQIKPMAPPDEVDQLKALFPHTWNETPLVIVPNEEEIACKGAFMSSANQTILSTSSSDAPAGPPPLRLGIVLSGGQAPGGHNVIAGVYDYIKKRNRHSQLFGFRKGPQGIFNHEYEEISEETMDHYRNLGGFDMLMSGRHKIETAEQKAMSLQIAKKLDLHGLVVVGGDDSNTNAAVLAEYFRAQNCETCVVGVPKTIDGDLKNEFIETSFGFDTAVRTYAEFVGNLATDVATSGKYYHFVRLMGRAASNIALHVALLTRPNAVLIGEEIARKNQSLSDIVDELADMIEKREKIGKSFGIILVPEGLIEFIPEVKVLIDEINNTLAAGEFTESSLTPNSRELFESLPVSIQEQLLLDRDPHGNVQVSRIATERLLILMLRTKLQKRNPDALKNFTPRSHFFGYEGRAAFPSVFDANYCYALGCCAGVLVENNKTSYMAVVRDLQKPSVDWIPGGCPLTLMMNLEQRKGRLVPVIKKYLVDLDNPPFSQFAEVREEWKFKDIYSSPGPIQFFGPNKDNMSFAVQNPTKEQLLPEIEYGFEERKNRHHFAKSLGQLSPLQISRLKAPVPIPSVLMDPKVHLLASTKLNFQDPQTEASVASSFPLQSRLNRAVTLRATVTGTTGTSTIDYRNQRGLRIGVLLNGQQAAGVSNVLVGLFERLSMEVPRGKLFGFLRGVKALTRNPPEMFEISRDDLKLAVNQGGCELLGRYREAEMEIALDENIEATRRVCLEYNLDGLVLIGGRLTIATAAVLTEEFLRRNVPTKIVVVPATQNNNIDASLLESALGFDSASKCYGQLIGNLNTDSSSCAKYWLFVRLMGADKSQLTLESALSTHSNLVLISEEYTAGDKSLSDVVHDIADVVVARAQMGLHFGTVLIPEALVSSLPQFKQLLSDLNKLFRTLPADQAQIAAQRLAALDTSGPGILEALSPFSLALLRSLPDYFRQQLVQPRSGGIEFTRVSTEELLAGMVAAELWRREKEGRTCKLQFAPLCFFFGYQGRSSLPSPFDCSLGKAHGALAAILVKSGKTGYVTAPRGLAAPPERWICSCYPATAFLRLRGYGELELAPRSVPICPSDMVHLNGKAYKWLLDRKALWETGEHYRNPGPIQYDGPTTSDLSFCLELDHKEYLDMLAEVSDNVRQYLP